MNFDVKGNLKILRINRFFDFLKSLFNASFWLLKHWRMFPHHDHDVNWKKHCIQIKFWYCLHSYSFSRMFRTFWKIRIGSSFSNGTSLWSLEWIHLRFASLIVLRRCWDARDKCRSAIWEMFFTKTLCQILKAVLRVNGLKLLAFFFF